MSKFIGECPLEIGSVHPSLIAARHCRRRHHYLIFVPIVSSVYNAFKFIGDRVFFAPVPAEHAKLAFFKHIF